MYNPRFQSSSEQITSLKKQLEEKINEINSQKTQYEEKIINLAFDSQEKIKQLNNKETNLLQQNTKFQQDIKYFQDLVSNNTIQNSKLFQENESYKKLQKDLEIENNQLKLEFCRQEQKLKTESISLKKQLENKINEINSQKTQYEQKIVDLKQDSQEKIKQLNNKETNFIQQNTKFEEEISYFKNLVSLKEIQISQLLKENENYSKIQKDIEIENQQLKWELQNLSSQFKEQTNKLTISEQNSQKFKEQLSAEEKVVNDVTVEKNKLMITNQLLDKNLEDMKKERNSNLNSYTDQCSELAQIKSEYLQLQKNHEDKEALLNKKEDSIKTLEQQISDLNRDYKSFQDSSSGLKSELQVLKQEQDKLNKFVDKKSESDYGYDIIIKMKSIRDLEQKEDVNKSLHQKEKENKQLELKDEGDKSQKQSGGLQVQTFGSITKTTFENVLVVGMQGYRNKGKTFLLNSLIDQHFPSDYHVSTPGICLKHHAIDGKNVVYLDSEGLNCPIKINYDQNENYKKFMDSKLNNSNIPPNPVFEQKLQEDIKDHHWDLKATEQIQQDFILQSSNILIVVVSNLTLDDQKLIHSLSQRFVTDNKNPQKKQLYVVHNLQDHRRPEYVLDYFEELKKIFPVRPVPYTQIQMIHDKENNLILCDNVHPHINHIVMGHQNSLAGQLYNRFALEYLRHAIGIHQGETNFDVKKKLTEYINKQLKSFVSLTSPPEPNEGIQKTSNFDQNLTTYEEQNQRIILKEGWKIQKIKELQVNVFGTLEKDCYYSLINSKKNSNERQLLIEVPGSVNLKTKFDKKTGQFTIHINQSNNIEDEIGDIYVSTRKIEEKYHTIQVCDKDESWIYKREQNPQIKDGIVKFVFEKEEDDELK